MCIKGALKLRLCFILKYIIKICTPKGSIQWRSARSLWQWLLGSFQLRLWSLALPRPECLKGFILGCCLKRSYLHLDHLGGIAIARHHQHCDNACCILGCCLKGSYRVHLGRLPKVIYRHRRHHITSCNYMQGLGTKRWATVRPFVMLSINHIE